MAHERHPKSNARRECLLIRCGTETLGRVEVVEGEIPVTQANEAALRQALESAGAEFIDENGGGPGVRLRKSGKEKPRK
jgi:hypothetical protein